MHIQVSINQVHIRKSLAANSLLRFLLHPCKNEGLSLPSLPSQLRFRSLHNNQQQSVYLGEGTFASQKSLTYQMSLNFYYIYIYIKEIALWFKANTNACSQKRFSSCFFSCIFFMAPVSGWDIIVSNSTFCPHSWKWASPKLLLLWGVPSLQWSVSIKSGQKEGMGGDPATWSWGGKSHWCTWWAKIAHCGLIQLMSYWG